MVGADFALLGGMQHSKNDEGVDFGSLSQLRDEIRVRVHLAQLDAKEKWQ